MNMTSLRAGLDVGSTTLKFVVVDGEGKVSFKHYARHNADIPQALDDLFVQLSTRYPVGTFRLAVTGSAGMGIAERCGLPFVQEVVGACRVVESHYPAAASLVDIGGEDAKMIFFESGRAPDMRMNGSCAGGTGAFIDQMAVLLNVSVEELGPLALRAEKLHSIASRCGVFSKTDVQNLLSRNARREDVAASIFHAVSVQVITTLSRGYSLRPSVVLCGGPFAYIPYMRTAFARACGLREEAFILPENAEAIPAWGAALSADAHAQEMSAGELCGLFREKNVPTTVGRSQGLMPLFRDEGEFIRWRESKERYKLPSAPLSTANDGECFLGVDSGSTTTKVVLLNRHGELIYWTYRRNAGSPLEALAEAFAELVAEAELQGVSPRIARSCVTGYGEDLMRKAFGLDYGMVETLAHFQAAAHFEPRVTFILDIGGQDMKAAFVENGVVTRLEINEACSSGCGSFIETFAQSLGHDVREFAQAACRSERPCNLGTRCTVFMNSRVKQSLREGASHADISAGLGYAVVRNSLNKVLKIKNFDELGDYVMVQGGTMRNPAICRAFELETGKQVIITDRPELMGAFGAALHAMRLSEQHGANTRDLVEVAAPEDFTTRSTVCKGCHNCCEVVLFNFENGERYFAGNKCEKVFSNQGKRQVCGANSSEWKCEQLFASENSLFDKLEKRGVIGIPRALDTYEHFLFWQTLFEGCGYRVVLSGESSMRLAEEGAHTIMSDNICFPAKLMHGHVLDLAKRGVDRIFLPFVVFAPEGNPGEQNSFNCPVVSGYSEVIRSAITRETIGDIPIDAPTISFKNLNLLKRQCWNYIKELPAPFPPVRRADFESAFSSALVRQQAWEADLVAENARIVRQADEQGRMVIMLAGRPYHADPLIQHKVSQLISSFGVDVITEDLVRGAAIAPGESESVHQWAFTNRIVAAARWVAAAGPRVHYVQLTSFGCGPDAYVVDEAVAALRRYGKTATVLKVDDVNNPGSLRLRIRSLIESLRNATHADKPVVPAPSVLQKRFEVEDRGRTLLLPWFGDAYSPYLPPLFKLAGYRAENIRPAGDSDVHLGLRYSNNEICYPATLVVGYFMQAMASGKYKPEEVAFGITQTGGQCRATNYMALVKGALQQAGYGDIPVFSVAVGRGKLNEQPGFTLDIKRLILPIFRTLIYADIMSSLLLASRPRERRAGEAQRIYDSYTQRALELVARNETRQLYTLLERAVFDFNNAIIIKSLPRVGLVGEIFVKYSSHANRGIVDWMIRNGLEPVVPAITEFFLEFIASQQVRVQSDVERSTLSVRMLPLVERLIFSVIRGMESRVGRFPYYRKIGRPTDEARLAAPIINLNAQFGEGWLIPASFARFAQEGINSVVCLQPFGCIANHIVAKGIEKRTKELYPNLSLLFLDLDSGVSDVNFFNRLYFLKENARTMFGVS